mgnify:CR=1 FL=1
MWGNAGLFQEFLALDVSHAVAGRTVVEPSTDLIALQHSRQATDVVDVCVGEHDQTAFALGLILDWARVAGDEEIADGFVEDLEQDYPFLDRSVYDTLQRIRAASRVGLPRESRISRA